MAKLTTLDYYSKACLERGCAALNKFCKYNVNLTSLERHVSVLVKYCSDNGYCTFDDIPKEAPVEEPKKKAKKKPDYVPVDDVEANTPEAQEKMAQSAFKEANKDDPNG